MEIKYGGTPPPGLRGTKYPELDRYLSTATPANPLSDDGWICVKTVTLSEYHQVWNFLTRRVKRLNINIERHSVKAGNQGRRDIWVRVIAPKKERDANGQ